LDYQGTTAEILILDELSYKVRAIATSSTAQLLKTHNMAPSNEPHHSEVENLPDAASPTNYQAAHHVLSTNELLCKIIAHLPLKDVFIAAAVCRGWREAIAAEPTIQHALSLKPRDVHEVIAEDVYILDLEHPMPMQKCSIIGEVNPWASDIYGHVHGDPSSSLHPSINTEFLHRGGLWREKANPSCRTSTLRRSIHVSR
jgi:hypothetical protein